MNLIDLAVDIGKKKYSNKTGFLHHHHEKQSNSFETIPIFENFAFALALLRTRNVDNVAMAIDLVKKLRGFQNEEGFFPMYIHEFPQVNYNLNVDICIALFWIDREFFKLFDRELKKVLRRLIKACDKKSFCFSKNVLLKFKVLSSLFSKKRIDSLDFLLDSKEDIKDMLLAIQMVDLENKKKQSRDLLKKALSFYSSTDYIGPPIDLFQNESAPELTFSDLFVLSYLKKLSKIDHPIFMLGGLIRPVNFSIEADPFELDQWHCLRNKGVSIISMKKSTPIDKRFRGFHLFRAFFKNSLVCQDFESQFSSEIKEDHLILKFDLSKDIKLDQFEIQFFTEMSSEVLVDNTKATSFKCGDRISILNDDKKGVILSFFSDALFTGHILRSNRHSQLVKNRVLAFDYAIALRTIRRSSDCSVEVKIYQAG